MSSEKEHKVKNIFVQGSIPPQKVSDMITKHQTMTGIGAHDIFLGQVRADEKEEGVVRCIEYTSYEEMANKVMHEIREDVFSRFDLHCMHVLHSLGPVPVGEISLLVFVSSTHRQDSFDACRELVERIKKQLPVWGKEILGNDSSSWKVNS
jgi:molybdopterin synthase catalytic subunit